MIEFGAANLPHGVRLERADDGSRLRLVAERDLDGLATMWFAQSTVWAEIDPATVPDDVEYLGFAFTQFALPVVAGSDLDFDFQPAENLRAPAAMIPLLIRSSAGVVLFAPVTNPHEQVITIVDGRIRWGWHGDLDEVPAGYASELGIYRGTSSSAVLEQWGRELREAAGIIRRPASANAVTSHLSYWTDNGAAYWYRTEAGRTIADSVVDVVHSLHAHDVPVRAVELDSWFYRHETSRPIDEIGYPHDVPPSGAWEWKPRDDAFPSADPADPALRRSDAIERFTERLGRPPLVLHARHIAPEAPDVDPAAWWVDLLAAQPHDPAYFRRWFDDAVRWGATCIEQDWMLIYCFGVRALRSAPRRAAAWQRALDEHARATDIDLLWCMATPADLIAAVEFDRVIAVRTCDDYRFAADPAMLWTWFLTVNRLSNVLGLRAFKDCFFSNPDVVDGSDPIDGDVHAELEALLAALSAGPVGIGDRIDRTNRDIVMRTCDDDGRLRHTDHAIGLIDDCLFGAPAAGRRLAWATTSTTLVSSSPSGSGEQTWTYVLAINTASDGRTITDRLDLDDIGLTEAHGIHDWRRGAAEIGTSIGLELEARDWALFVCCPIVDGKFEVGDTTKYVTVASSTTP
jgi:hypothetical protein